MARPKGTKIFQKRVNISITDKLAAEISEFARENDLSESEAMRTLIRRGINWAKKARGEPMNRPSNVPQKDYKLNESEMKELYEIAKTKWVD